MGSIFAPVRSDKGTSCRSENAEAARTTRIPPSPQPSSPLLKGEEGTGVGGFCQRKPFLRAEQGWLMYTLIRNHAGEAIFRTPSAQGVTIPEKCVIIGIAVRERRVAETQLKEDER
jgi:hypothetical protein